MAERIGDWCQTASGIQFWPLDPRPDEILLEDIAYAASKLCRFGGQIPRHEIYSVAQHCVLVSRTVQSDTRVHPTARTEMALIGLLHDATEAYIADVIRPIKRFLSDYEAVEFKLALVMGERFGLGRKLAELPHVVKEADNRMLFTEKRDLLAPEPAPWAGVVEPYEFNIRPWSIEFAFSEFMMRARDLGVR